MVALTFRGLVAPVLTPFNDNLTLNTDVVLPYAEFLSNSGIKGVLVNGTSGEGMSMNVSERKQITEAWSEAVKSTKQHLMVQIGGAPLPDVLELAKHAEQLKVDSLLCLPELYFKPTTPKDLIRYLKQVGEAAPNTPLLYYHIPTFTNVNIHMGQFLNEIQHQVPSFCGIKFTSNNLDEGVAAVTAANSRFAVFLGADSLMAGAYTLGFNSAIATTLNIYPQLGIQILDSVQQSKIEQARDYQHKLTKLCETITKHGSWVSTMKTAMNLFTPIYVGHVRQPLVKLTPAQINEMEETIKTLKH